MVIHRAQVAEANAHAIALLAHQRRRPEDLAVDRQDVKSFISSVGRSSRRTDHS
jgi:hypothetical protein